jgi:hypothetical protein
MHNERCTTDWPAAEEFQPIFTELSGVAEWDVL